MIQDSLLTRLSLCQQRARADGEIRKYVFQHGAAVCVSEGKPDEQEVESPVASVTSCGGPGWKGDPWEMGLITVISIISAV